MILVWFSLFSPLFFVSVWRRGAAGLGPVELGRKSPSQDEERQIRSGQAARELHTQVLLSIPNLQAGSRVGHFFSCGF